MPSAGSSVKIYGSVAPNPGQASLGFVVDQSLTGSYSAKQGGTGLYHELLWESPTLSEGSHTLVITQTAAQSNGVIYLDYIMYDTESAVGTYFVDDRDPRIAYTPPWRQFDGTENDFQHTSSESTNLGDSFSFQFEGAFWVVSDFPHVLILRIRLCDPILRRLNHIRCRLCNRFHHPRRRRALHLHRTEPYPRHHEQPHIPRRRPLGRYPHPRRDQHERAYGVDGLPPRHAAPRLFFGRHHLPTAADVTGNHYRHYGHYG